MMTRTILVVDDEPDLVVTCERLLQRLGHTCLRAHTGSDAMARIDREGPDLVVRISGWSGRMAWPWRVTPATTSRRSR
jgi:DNA-binding response OmpR family regulator